MSKLPVFLLFIYIVISCRALTVQMSVEPLEVKDIQEVERRILGELTRNARTKRDVYEYTYSASTKVESYVSFTMKKTETGNGQVFIIGPGENNQNFVKINTAV